MRIVHVTDCYLPRLGGIERQVHDLAIRQLAAGHDVEVITSVRGTGNDADSAVRVHRPRGARGAPTSVLYGSSWSQRDQVLSGAFDVVHIHASTMSPMAFLAAGAASRAGIPTVITAHSLWAYASPIFAAADAILEWRDWPLVWSAVSTAAVEPLRRMLPASTPISVLPNGVDADAWRVPRRARRPDRIVVASVMRLAARKRPRQLLGMLRAARGQVPASIRMEAVIVGDGPQRAALQRYLDRHRMGDWTTLTGAADHARIRTIFADSDFYVAPAVLESFGIAALEAHCSGLPVVAHANSGIRDFIAHGDSGLLAVSDEDMVSCITRLVRSPDELDRLSGRVANGRLPTSWPSILGRCEQLYDQARLVVGHQRQPQ